MHIIHFLGRLFKVLILSYLCLLCAGIIPSFIEYPKFKWNSILWDIDKRKDAIIYGGAFLSVFVLIIHHILIKLITRKRVRKFKNIYGGVILVSVEFYISIISMAFLFSISLMIIFFLHFIFGCLISYTYNKMYKVE